MSDTAVMEGKAVEVLWKRTAETHPALAAGNRPVETSTTYKLKNQPTRNLQCVDMFSDDFFSFAGLCKRFGEQKGKEYADTLIAKSATIDIQRVARALLKRVASGAATPEEEFAKFPEEYVPGMRLTSTSVDPEDVANSLASLPLAERMEQLKKILPPAIANNEKLLKQVAEGYGK